jgi:hypothetical protein
MQLIYLNGSVAELPALIVSRRVATLLPNATALTRRDTLVREFANNPASAGRRLIGSVAVAALILAFGLLTPATPADAAESGTTATPRPALAPPSAYENSATKPRSSTLAPCVFFTDGDRVHRSGADVSGHGWWVRINCPAGTKAKVTIWLEEYFSDGTWRVKAEGDKTVYSGGGRANRAAAHASCNSFSAFVSWRSRIDVDLVGRVDSAEQAITPVQDLACIVN